MIIIFGNDDRETRCDQRLETFEDRRMGFHTILANGCRKKVVVDFDENRVSLLQIVEEVARTGYQALAA